MKRNQMKELPPRRPPESGIHCSLTSKRLSVLLNKMLDTKDIIILTAAVYLGSVVSRFFSALTDGIIAPLLAPLGSKDLTQSVVVVGGVTLKTGELLAATIPVSYTHLRAHET